MPEDELQSRVPRLHGRHVKRPRLTQLLDESTAQSLVLIGPAGYGKTGLACEWLEGRRDVAWFRATAGAADVAAFSVGLADAIEPLVPSCGVRIRQRLTVAEAPEKATRPLAEILAADLAGWPSGAWLVIDDYHLAAESQAVEEFTDWLLQRCAPLRVLITSRSRPAWLSARRLIHGEALEIGPGQLAMTRAEAAALLAGRSSEEISQLVHRAEGWPALLGLAAMAASHAIPEARVSEELYRYFAEEVLNSQPPEVRDFMLRACLLPVIVDDPCTTEALGLAYSDNILRLLRDRCLIHEAGPSQHAFHPLLKNLLRLELRRSHARLARDLVSSLLSCLLREGEWEDAFELASTEQLNEERTKVLMLAAPTLLASGRLEVLEAWLDTCGEVRNEPETALLRAELLYRKGGLREAEFQAMLAVGTLPDGHPAASRAWYLAGQSAYLLSEFEQALPRFHRASATAVTPVDQANAARGTFSVCLDLEQNIAASLDDLMSQDSPDLLVSVQQVLAAAIMAAFNGNPGEASRILAASLPKANEVISPMIRSQYYFNIANAELLRARYASARTYALQALDLCTSFGLAFARPDCALVATLAAIGTRAYPTARRALATIHEDVLDDPYLETAYAIAEVRLSLATRDPGEALARTQRTWLASAPRAAKGELMGLAALAAAAAGESGLVDELGHRCADLTVEALPGDLLSLARIVVAARLGCAAPEAGALIRDLYDRELLDPIVTAYRAYPPLLRHLAADPQTVEPLRKIVYVARDHRIARSVGCHELIERDIRTADLTGREQEIYHYIRSGCSNRDIAQQLFITESTVKVHVRHLLRKLGMKNRVQVALTALDDSELAHLKLGG